MAVTVFLPVLTQHTQQSCSFSKSLGAPCNSPHFLRQPLHLVSSTTTHVNHQIKFSGIFSPLLSSFGDVSLTFFDSTCVEEYLHLDKDLARSFPSLASKTQISQSPNIIISSPPPHLDNLHHYHHYYYYYHHHHHHHQEQQ